MRRKIEEHEKRILDLLYIEKTIVNIIHGEVNEIISGRGRNNDQIRESIIYAMNDRFPQENKNEILHK